ncbi:MAG TPA: FxsA family protein [Solirubrobacterales bacterium]|nr:FxsA family protein [Solirubrobacterales bacterium]
MPVLVLLFIALPIVELLVVIQVARGIGVVPTLALIVFTAIVGAILLRSQGRAAWRRFNLALAEGRVPARETADGAMIIFGGALLLTPGFVTDATGLALLAPPTRALVRRGISGMARRRLAFTWWVARPGRGRGGPGPGPGRGAPGAGPGRYGAGPGDYDYEGSAREVSDAEHQLPDAGGGDHDR